MANFAILGAAGYIAPKHMQAIYHTGNQLVAAVDPRDSVGILDSYNPFILYFNDVERFQNYLEWCNSSEENRINYVSICTPNYMHDIHCRMTLYTDADAICEKPVVIEPWRLDTLIQDEIITGHRVYPILQMRYHPGLMDLKKIITDDYHHVKLIYHTPRGPWYSASWKGDEYKSGGLLMNIGVHMFDLMIWLFGIPEKAEVRLLLPDYARGFLWHKQAEVEWELSINPRYSMQRTILVDGKHYYFEPSQSLHSKAYTAIVNGKGLSLETVRPSIELVQRLKNG